MAFNAPVVTGYAGGWDPNAMRTGTGAEANYNAVTRYARDGFERRLGMNLGKSGYRAYRAVMRSLNGAGAGAAVAAGASYTRVAATNAPGGVAPMEVYALVTGITSTIQRDYLTNNVYDPIYRAENDAVDLSGNGGGGKRGI